MLSRARDCIATPGAVSDWAPFCATLKTIGTEVYDKYKGVFALNEFDVRVALVLTGALRHPDDVAGRRSSTLLLWEVARSFDPVRAVG